MKIHEQIIDIISQDNGQVDWRGLALYFAKKHPGIFMRACNSMGNIPWQETAKNMFLNGDKVGAITICRNRTGLGLKEAKDAVESLVDGVDS